MVMIKGGQTLGWRLGEAADFLIAHLAGTELPSETIFLLAQEAGTSAGSINRAKQIVNAKSRRKNNKWHMTVPKEMTGRIFSTPRLTPRAYLLKPLANPVISSDWVSVVSETDDGNKINIPSRVSSSAGLRVKVGQYEFEADENFPADKLAELLRGLAVNAE